MSDNQDYPRIPVQDLASFEGRAKHLLKIRNKDGELINFEFLQSQKILNEIIEEEFKRTKREYGAAQCRIIILKPRQIGATTYSNLRSLDTQIHDEGSNGVITAHDQDTTEKIYEIYKRAYDNLPEFVVPTLDGDDMTRRQYVQYMLDKSGKDPSQVDLSSKEYNSTQTIKIKPEPETYSGKRIGFKDTDSMTSIFTAGKGDTGGLGGTIRRIHTCIHKDSKVILSNGRAIPIKDVNVGDNVICSDGTVAPVKNKIDTGTKQTFSIETWLTDEDIKVSKDHKILTVSGWKRCEQLTGDDYVQLPDITLTDEIKEYTYDLDSRKNIRWSTTQGIKKHTFELNYDFGYLIGYYLAEGHVKYDKSKDIYTYVTFSSHIDETYNEKIIEDFFHLATSVSVKERPNHRKITVFYGCYLANMLNDICGRTDGKHIPDWFFKTNKDFINGVLVGYLSGDGSKTKNRTDNTRNGYDRWEPENSAETIHQYLKEKEQIKNRPTVVDLYEKYGISESTAYLWKFDYIDKTLEEIKEERYDCLITYSPETIFNFLTEYKKIKQNKKKTVKQLNQEYGIALTTSCEWEKKYKDKSVEYIRNDYGGHLANIEDVKEYNYITATSICERISRQLRRLVLGLGVGVPSIKFYDNRYRYDVKTRDIFQLMISGKPAKHFIERIDGIEPATNGSNGANRRWKEVDGKYFVQIKSIEKSDVTQTYDLEIDHETHDFETSIGIVSNSETGSYAKYKDLMQAMKPSIPKFADNVLFINESTANGTTGDGEGYYKAWNNAVKGWEAYQQGNVQTYNGFRPVFIPWYMIDEYELPLAGGKYESIEQIDFGSPEQKRKFLEREKELLDEGIYNPLTESQQILTPEKINWYRFIIKTDCEFDYKAAQRFYPTTPEEAFVASSHCFFDAYKLNQRKTRLLNDPPEYEIGEIEWSDDADDLTFVPSSTGNLTIYAKPEPDWENRYVIGADIAKGREEGDYSVAYVFDRLQQEYVACYYGRIDQDIFADRLMELGLYYNEALIVPERNMSMVVELIQPDGLTPYIGELYFVERGRSIDYGYWTGGGESGSRNILLNTHKKFLRENPQGYDVLPDVHTVDEHISFVRKQTNTGVKYEADEGSHDDRVFGASFCIIGDQWWEVAPEKYEPSRITEIITRPNKRRKKFIRQHELGTK